MWELLDLLGWIADFGTLDPKDTSAGWFIFTAAAYGLFGLLFVGGGAFQLTRHGDTWTTASGLFLVAAGAAFLIRIGYGIRYLMRAKRGTT